MFTGLIEEVGNLTDIQQDTAGASLTISAQTVLENLAVGDSIAIDGVCTTVTEFSQAAQTFTIQASNETLRKTIIGTYTPGTSVNLERPLLPTSRLGGHFVTGHVDGTAQIIQKTEEGLSWIYTFRLNNSEWSPLLVPKGSVALLGISLTVNTVQDDTFSVAIIPHTMEKTSLGQYTEGHTINLELDILGKYIQRFASAATGQNDSTLQPAFESEAFLDTICP